VAVSVKFEDKTGAAGLVFHADGEDKHYGFYPSAGKLRLSRFDGPSVFDWKVLHDIPSEHYQEGKWNDLKVRVAADKLTCYLNGHEVFASTDIGLTQGQVGLAKFRETSAEFRRFRIGKELADDKVDEQALAALRDQVAALPSLANIDAAQVESLAQNGEAAGAALRREAEALETRAKELRLIAADARTLRVTNSLAKTLEQTDEAGRFNLLRAALQLALLDDEELELEIYEEQVDRMAAEIEQRLPKDADEAAKLAALDKYLFEDNGFHGSRTEYYHKANSHLHRVIDDREGLPITLSLLYIELGRRLNLSIEGVGLPGHFVVRHVPAEGEPQLIDVFERGQKLSREDAAKIVRDFGGTELTAAHLAPYSQREILVRMLRNLLGVAQRSEDREAMLRYVTAVLVLEPDSARDRGMRGVLCFETGRREAAASAMEPLQHAAQASASAPLRPATHEAQAPRVASLLPPVTSLRLRLPLPPLLSNPPLRRLLQLLPLATLRPAQAHRVRIRIFQRTCEHLIHRRLVQKR
jgi:serine protease Do